MTKLDIGNLLIVGARIEELVETLGVSYIEACLIYSEENNLEVEYVGEVLKKNQNLKAKIQREGEALNFLAKEARLEI
jgi:Phage late-transcription coactivator